MTTFLLYEIKVAIILTVFYLFYRLLLSKETLHQLNRAVLLGTVLASFVLPFCVITIHRTSNVSVMIAQMGQQSVANHSTFAAADGVGMAAYIHYFQWIAIVVFFLGMSFVLGRMMFSLFKVRQIIQTGERFLQPDGTTLIVTDRKVVPFSWMRYIVLGRQDYESNCQTILLHEQGHIAHHHSWDMLLVDIITSLQWFNPTIWMLRDDLRAIHEYEADAMVLSHGMNARQYQLLLIRKAADMGGTLLSTVLITVL
ncbi:MAG: M56 family metallopeptidase [Prevotella sp.]